VNGGFSFAVTIFRQTLVQQTRGKLLSVPLIAFAFLFCIALAHGSEGDYPALRESIDPKLQAAFEKALDKKYVSQTKILHQWMRRKV